MKIIMFILIGMLCMVGLVYAFTIGNNISQQQLDGLNLSNLNLSNGFLREDGKVVWDCQRIGFVKYCSVYVNFTTVEPNYDDSGTFIDYSTMYNVEGFMFEAKKYVNMKNEHNVTYARKQLKDFLKNEYYIFDAENKDKIAKYQTQPTYDMDDIMSGINLD